MELHDSIIVLTCVQRVLLVTNFGIFFYTQNALNKTENNNHIVQPIPGVPTKSKNSKHKIDCHCADSIGSLLLLFAPPH